MIDFYNLAISRSIGAQLAVALGSQPDQVMSGIALIALPSMTGLLLGAVLMAFAQWRGRLVRLWVPIATTAGMLGITFLATTFVPAVVACAVLTVGLLAQADGLRRCPDAVYASGGSAGSNDA